mmetsp:Transcript_22262/g.34439  ORF Transcript_22262/g.34439 Transcript_22262/m.34439 type:complete len:114 (+) Transcript_22262:58-399(+)
MKAQDSSLTQKLMHPFIMEEWKNLANKEPYYVTARLHFKQYKELLQEWKEDLAAKGLTPEDVEPPKRESKKKSKKQTKTAKRSDKQKEERHSESLEEPIQDSVKVEKKPDRVK